MLKCKKEGCNSPRWSGGLCKNHVPKKPKNKEELLKLQEFFLSIWKKRRHACEICGEKLGNVPLSYMFDHLLEKSKHPELKYEEENICIMCLECHDEKSRGIMSKKVENKIKSLKQTKL